VLKSNKAICIIRVSSLRQEDGCSYELQNEMMKEYAKENKLSIEREFRFAESAKDSAKRIKYRNAISWALEQRIVHILIGVPYGSRTRVFAVKGRCPRPLDEGNLRSFRLSKIWSPAMGSNHGPSP
jgi:hypothetical protein